MRPGHEHAQALQDIATTVSSRCLWYHQLPVRLPASAAAWGIRILMFFDTMCHPASLQYEQEIAYQGKADKG
jgi:hypothetical protein